MMKHNLQERGLFSLRRDGREEDDNKVDKILNPWAADSRLWNFIFLASCLIGVSIDPLFLYVPIVDDNRKCLKRDYNMEIIALVLRSVTDLFYVFHVCFRLHNALKMSKELHVSIFTNFPWFHLLIDILSILPLPQVVVLLYFSQITGSRSLSGRKFINLILLLQYVPRLFRVYLTAKEIGKGFDSLISQRVWVRCAFFFFVYLNFGHVFGAFWYFYSIFRETACWHEACKYHMPKQCTPGFFDCSLGIESHPIKNLTKLNQYCPINPPDPKIFNFGMFSGAIESRIVNNTDFPTKFTRSFFWGLKNLSSFGSNLDTSGNIVENLFAILISILGLLLFLYLIGNLQTYMQLETTKSEEDRKKISIIQPEIDSYLTNHGIPSRKKKLINKYLSRKIRQGEDIDVKYLFSILEEHADQGQHKSHETFAAWVTKLSDMKKHESSTMEQKVELWISKNGIPNDLKLKIKNYVKFKLQEGKDINIEHLMYILPPTLRICMTEHMCFSILKKVPSFRNIDENVYETICKFLKPVTYLENSYIIRKGEPIDMVLFITQGTMWTFGNGIIPMNRLQKGDYYGNELIEWQLNSTFYYEFPISTCNLKSHTKVEAFVLMANDLEHVLSSCWSKFSKRYSTIEAMSEGIKFFAATTVQRGFHRYMKNKKAQQKTILNICVN
uniref:Cyclic nucleotide-binding domain-containing protein n=1 Tax=Cannabis sativa TaxID=3483 RepID=A0A803PJP7_CANSA